MRTIFYAGGLIAAASIAQAQAPAATLPNQAELPAPAATSTAPNPGNDEVSARRKLEESGYRDLRNVTPNGDGTFSAQAIRDQPGTIRPTPDLKVDIDSQGNVRER
jgi:hypothetical protein